MRLDPLDPPLSAKLRMRYTTRRRINALHTYKLDKLEALVGFTGIRGPGTRKGGFAVQEGSRSSSVDTEDAARAFMRAADREQQEVFNGEQSDEEDGTDAPAGEGGDDEEEINALAVQMSEAIVDEPAVSNFVGGVPSNMLHTWSL